MGLRELSKEGVDQRMLAKFIERRQVPDVEDAVWREAVPGPGILAGDLHGVASADEGLGDDLLAE